MTISVLAIAYATVHVSKSIYINNINV